MDAAKGSAPKASAPTVRKPNAKKKAPVTPAKQSPASKGVGGKDRVTIGKQLEGKGTAAQSSGLVKGFQDAYKGVGGHDEGSATAKKIGDTGTGKLAGKKLTTAEHMLRDQGYSLKDIYTKGKDGKNLVDKFQEANGIKDLRKMRDNQSFGAPGSKIGESKPAPAQPRADVDGPSDAKLGKELAGYQQARNGPGKDGRIHLTHPGKPGHDKFVTPEEFAAGGLRTAPNDPKIASSKPPAQTSGVAPIAGPAAPAAPAAPAEVDGPSDAQLGKSLAGYQPVGGGPNRRGQIHLTHPAKPGHDKFVSPEEFAAGGLRF